MTTRHLRILRKLLGKLMGKSAQKRTLLGQIYRNDNGNYYGKEFNTWRQDDPKPLQGISFAMTTRHLRILRKLLGKLKGKSAQKRTLLGQIYRNDNGNYYGKVK
jgi:hypothetical protein